jgi:hypothetical protein
MQHRFFIYRMISRSYVHLFTTPAKKTPKNEKENAEGCRILFFPVKILNPNFTAG